MIPQPHFCIYPKEINQHLKDTCALMYISTLFIIGNTGEQGNVHHQVRAVEYDSALRNVNPREPVRSGVRPSPSSQASCSGLRVSWAPRLGPGTGSRLLPADQSPPCGFPPARPKLGSSSEPLPPPPDGEASPGASCGPRGLQPDPPGPKGSPAKPRSEPPGQELRSRAACT